MICKVAKKGLIGLALGGAALGLIFGTAAPSYVKTTFHRARNSVKQSVPTEFEVDRARNEIAALKPAIEEGMEAVVRAEIQAENLQKEIVATRDELNREGRALQALNEHRRTGDLHLTGGVAYTEKEILNDLAHRMDHYKLVKNVLAEKQETLKVLQKNVIAAREGLDAVRNAERDLTVRVEAAQARLNQIKANRASNEFSFDNSAVGQAKKTVTDLEMKIEEMSRLDDLKGKYVDRPVSVNIDGTRDVTKEIDAEFNSAPKGDKSTAEKF